MFEKAEMDAELHARLKSAGINPLDPDVRAINSVVSAYYAEKTAKVLQQVQEVLKIGTQLRCGAPEQCHSALTVGSGQSRALATACPPFPRREVDGGHGARPLVHNSNSTSERLCPPYNGTCARLRHGRLHARHAGVAG